MFAFFVKMQSTADTRLKPDACLKCRPRKSVQGRNTKKNKMETILKQLKATLENYVVIW